MRETKIQVPILIVNYNGLQYLPACLESLAADEYADIEPIVYVVDNASTDGSREYIQKDWPLVRLILSDTNLGFAGGNNLGLHALQRDLPECRYFLLLNQDTIVEPGFLRPLVAALDDDTALGAVQPRLMLYPDTHTINSLGNVIHFLGFGYSSFNGYNESHVPRLPRAIAYASGAAVLLRMETVNEVGLFDDRMFMYLEDLDLGWKLWLRGWRVQLIPNSCVYHAYEFKRGMKHFFYFERNRFWILFKNYRWRTLCCIAPALLIMELGLIARSIMNGTFGIKWSVYRYFCSRKVWEELLDDRRIVQKTRQLTDRELLRLFSGRITFQPLESFSLKYIANPFFSFYHRCISRIITW